MSDSQRIIDALSHQLESNDQVHALWLEGSAARGQADEYSDLDFWLLVDDTYLDGVQAEVRSALEQIGTLDLNYQMNVSGERGHVVYHIAGMSEFLTIDINVRKISLGTEVTAQLDDIRVIFDKSKLIKLIQPAQGSFDEAEAKTRLLDFYRVQRPNVLKNLRREKPLEAIVYYQSLLEYIVKYYRLKSGLVAKKDFRFKHLYHDLAPEITAKIEYFYFISADDLESRLDELGDWIKEL